MCVYVCVCRYISRLLFSHDGLVASMCVCVCVYVCVSQWTRYRYVCVGSWICGGVGVYVCVCRYVSGLLYV